MFVWTFLALIGHNIPVKIVPFKSIALTDILHDQMSDQNNFCPDNMAWHILQLTNGRMPLMLLIKAQISR